MNLNAKDATKILNEEIIIAAQIIPKITVIIDPAPTMILRLLPQSKMSAIATIISPKASSCTSEAITWKTIEAKDSVVLNDISEFNHTVEMQLKPKNLFNVYAVIGNSKAVNNLDGSITILSGENSFCTFESA